MISFYDWVIQFRNKKSKFKGAGKLIYDDPDFPKDVETSDVLLVYLDNNYYVCKMDLDAWYDLFNLYLKELKKK